MRLFPLKAVYPDSPTKLPSPPKKNPCPTNANHVLFSPPSAHRQPKGKGAKPL